MSVCRRRPSASVTVAVCVSSSDPVYVRFRVRVVLLMADGEKRSVTETVLVMNREKDSVSDGVCSSDWVGRLMDWVNVLLGGEAVTDCVTISERAKVDESLAL